MAVKTWEAAKTLLEQAEPAEIAIPAWSKATISVSLLKPENLIFKLFGKRLVKEPFNFAPLLYLIIFFHNLFRKSRTYLERFSRFLTAKSIDLAVPKI